MYRHSFTHAYVYGYIRFAYGYIRFAYGYIRFAYGYIRFIVFGAVVSFFSIYGGVWAFSDIFHAMDEEEDTQCHSGIGDDEDRSERGDEVDRCFQFVSDLIASDGCPLRTHSNSTDGRKMFSVYDVMRRTHCWTEGTMPVVYFRAMAGDKRNNYFEGRLESVVPDGGKRKTPCMDLCGLSMLMSIIRPSCTKGSAAQVPRKRAKKDSARKEAPVETNTTLELGLRLELKKVELELEKTRLETERLCARRRDSCEVNSPVERTPTPVSPVVRAPTPEPPVTKPPSPEPPAADPCHTTSSTMGGGEEPRVFVKTPHARGQQPVRKIRFSKPPGTEGPPTPTPTYKDSMFSMHGNGEY